ncbi:hypothetical protein FHX57_006277 [Paraburkholderia tropica]|uniref:hypothetical protein n=1 Tax=Paraburkholderia tropica TaxID=92647 RepID=UPI0016141613|nr:hypothetical protein [Paraburkholderia tropica]MBB3003900.1 hypothetical protein [Paraburkholderia tropica]MBB6322744.1 hypothetical protein [Paraburkholderia tropica]
MRKAKATIRRHVNKSDLLPLAGAKVRALSVQYHMSLAALRGGYGSNENIGVLTGALYMAYVLECNHNETRPDPAIFRAADSALWNCHERATEHGAPWKLERGESDALCALLALHDMQLAS